LLIPQFAALQHEILKLSLSKRRINQEGLWGFGAVPNVISRRGMSCQLHGPPALPPKKVFSLVFRFISPLKFLNTIRCIHISSMLATCLAHLNIIAVFHPISNDEEEHQAL